MSMPGFLKLFFSGKSVCVRVCVCVCVCVSAPRATKNHSREMKSEYPIKQVLATAFQFLCMALAIDTIDGQGLSNEAHRELL